MDDTRNPMNTSDVTGDTPFEVEHTWKASRGFGAQRDGFRPTISYVVAIKPCGCTGPTLGSIETVRLPSPRSNNDNGYTAPRSFDPKAEGYEWRQETKDRIGIYLHGDRVVGKRWFGGDERTMLKQWAWNHFRRTQREAMRPHKPDGYMHRTAQEALDRKPHLQCKLWAVFPEGRYRYDRKRKPVGYVWGKDAAALALRNYWAAKNHESGMPTNAMTAFVNGLSNRPKATV